MDDKQIEEMLRKLPKGGDYPGHLKTATRAEYTTRVRTNQKKSGCPLFVLSFISAVGILYFVYTHVIMAFVEGMMWVIGNGV